MQARMSNPAAVVPGAMQSLMALGRSVESNSVPKVTHMLMQLRASQINGCSFCVEMHSEELKKAGEADKRIFAVGAWRESPHFTEAERAALALSESVTRLSDRADPVSDDVWDQAKQHYDEPALGSLILSIATVNLWNRINAATKQVAGVWQA
jgi:AhpD family alkylhydroperoxidase